MGNDGMILNLIVTVLKLNHLPGRFPTLADTIQDCSVFADFNDQVDLHVQLFVNRQYVLKLIDPAAACP